ncbi:hypothetical protein PHET_04200 [Paragonimus heterotremus]|uniref:non-specific serine/threonine protein kinase n=1 Tax=Paragonimus heterotremus TaxID=100268 RepID=A0A8J4WS94_9TREM|nr:hypothetical protein PHET_04200 [Paragonimus heterotremus]
MQTEVLDGRYRVERKLDRGIAGVVYLVEDLKHASGKQIVSNIFIKDGQLKMGGFGISCLLTPTHDTVNTFVDTPYYMSPEVLKNEGYTNKSDICFMGTYSAVHLNGALQSDELDNISKLLENMFRDTVITRADSSTSVISAKLEELKAIWKFPDSVLGSILQSERTSPVKCESREATECSPEEQTTTPEVDISTLTPRERIRLGKHSEEDIEIAKLSHLRPNLQPPEEKILQDLRSISPMKNPETGEQIVTENDADDLFWPYESSIHNNSFIENQTECKAALSAAERRGPEAFCPSIDIPPSHTKETKKPDVLPTYWKLYSDMTCSDTMVNTTERSWLDHAPPVEDSDQGFALFVRQYLDAEHHVDEDNQSNVDTIYNLEHGAITFCESTLDDATSEAPYYSSYAQSIVTMIPEIVVASKHSSHCKQPESDFEDTGDDEESEQEREVERFDVDVATPHKDDDLAFEDTMLQAFNYMRSMLQQDHGSSTTMPRAMDSFTSTPHAKCKKIQQLRQQCMDKLGSKVFNDTYNYLYQRRVSERNSAGEVTILNELRQLCPDVATGFLIDQLVFFEYKEPVSDCKPRGQLPSMMKSRTID